MKYKDYDGSIEELIEMKLCEIEIAENVTILHAIESGSRAWGFASPDSDYDVRFIYVRNAKDYLRLDAKKDVIDWELNEVLDINGWDLTKALRLFYKSNVTLFEWANSPIVYKTTKEWEQIYKVAVKYFEKKSSLYQYNGTASSNYLEHLQEQYVKYKKYCYVIRPILACKWIEEKGCPPPVLFETLKEELLDEEMKQEVDELLRLKRNMNEAEKGPKIPKIDEFICEHLAHYKAYISELEVEKNNNWEELNQIFINCVLNKRKDKK